MVPAIDKVTDRLASWRRDIDVRLWLDIHARATLNRASGSLYGGNMPGVSTKNDAFHTAIMALVEDLPRPGWVRRHIIRIRTGRTWDNAVVIIKIFSEHGYLEGVLSCCFALGIDEDRVRSIYALIYE
jgi:hypothetical protein